MLLFISMTSIYAKLVSTALFVLFLVGAPAYAQIDGELRTQLPETPEPQDSFLQTHKAISTSLLNLSNGIDSYFGTIRSLDQKNGTNFRIYNISSKREGEGVYNVTHFRLRFKLPNLEKKFQLSFDRTNDREEELTTRPEDSLLVQNNDENFFRTGVSYFQDVLGIKTKFTPGAKISDPITLYANFDTWREIQFAQRFRTRISHRTFADSKDGLGQSATINLDFDLHRFLLFRLANEEIYRDKDNSLSVSHGPSFFYKLNDYNAMSFNYRGHFTNRPSYHLDYHLLSLSHRHAFYQNIWYIELSPGLIFPKENNFKGDAGISLKLEMIFG